VFLLLLPVLPLALNGCGSAQVTMATGTDLTPPPPPPNSPVAVVRLLEWAWNERDTTAIRDVFTGDFEFVFADADSSGNDYRVTPWTYSDELIMSRRVFAGGSPTEPPAITCELTFDPTLVVSPDPRPGKDPGWHRQITTSFDLRCRTAGVDLLARGHATFFAVRGDSATPPPRDTGTYPMDSTRWLLERWEDAMPPAVVASAPAGPAEIQPTWGAVKARYRRDLPLSTAP
jgi:hypothetical protein